MLAPPTDEFTRLTALEWVAEFLRIGKREMAQFSGDLVAAILPCLAHKVPEIKDAATRANDALLRLVREYAPALDNAPAQAESKEGSVISEILSAITLQFLNQYVCKKRAHRCNVLVLVFIYFAVVWCVQVATRLAALQWVLALQAAAASSVRRHVDELFPALLKLLSDVADEVRYTHASRSAR